jgi:hypothetical protein
VTRPRITVEGVADLNRSLRRADPEMQKALRRSFRGLAVKARDRIRSIVPARSGRARSSVRASATGKSAYVAAGKAAVPYVGWLDFGGTLQPSGKRRGTQVRPVVARGRYLYPTLDRLRPEMIRDAQAAIRHALARAGIHGG